MQRKFIESGILLRVVTPMVFDRSWVLLCSLGIDPFLRMGQLVEFPPALDRCHVRLLTLYSRPSQKHWNLSQEGWRDKEFMRFRPLLGNWSRHSEYFGLLVQFPSQARPAASAFIHLLVITLRYLCFNLVLSELLPSRPFLCDDSIRTFYDRRFQSPYSFIGSNTGHLVRSYPDNFIRYFFHF